MSTLSSIEWTDATWNPVRGCSKVSEGCRNCYAMKQAHRFSGPGKPYEGLTQLVVGKGPQWTGAVRTVPDVLEDPLRWRKPRRVFVNSMSDLFHEGVPDDFVDDVFGVMALATQHTFQILTKRPERMADYMAARVGLETRAETVARAAEHFGKITFDSRGSDRAYYYGSCAGITDEQLARRRRWPGWPLPNIWLGTSVENQAAADERIPHLLRTPAAVRFLSCEPLLGPVDLTQIGEYRGRRGVEPLSALDEIVGMVERPRVDWVIAGGESGPGARPLRIDWIRALVQQCRAVRVPVFVKQLGAHPVMLRKEFASTCAVAVECQHGFDACPICDAGDYELEPRDRKGGDPNEWPADLRVREFPEVRA